MKKIFIFAITILPLIIFSVNFSIFYENTIFNGTKYFSNTFIPKISYTSDNFKFIASMKFSNDGKYPPFYNEFYKDYYIKFQDAGIILSLENIEVKMGNFKNYDIINSPYSLFISSLGHSKPIISIKYEDQKFLYESRYMLSSYKANETINKGINLKYYAIKLNNFTFGFEETAVYVNRIFDFEYLSNPLPNFFIQYYRVNNLYGNIFNDNSLMGFFGNYKGEKYTIFGQILIDDFNANRFFNPQNDTVDKMAWSFGTVFQYNKLKIKLFHAGATKYTFQPSSIATSSNAFYYGYTYYNTLEINGYPISYEDTYVGYKYGENNIAFMVAAEYNGNIKFNTAVRIGCVRNKIPYKSLDR